MSEEYFHVDPESAVVKGFHRPGEPSAISGRDVSNQSPPPGAPAPSKRAFATVGSDELKKTVSPTTATAAAAGHNVKAIPFQPPLFSPEALSVETAAVLRDVDSARVAASHDQQALLGKLSSLLGEVSTVLQQLREPATPAPIAAVPVTLPSTLPSIASHVPVSSRPAAPVSAPAPFRPAQFSAGTEATFDHAPPTGETGFSAPGYHPQAMLAHGQQFVRAQTVRGKAADATHPRSTGLPSTGFMPHVNNWHATHQMEDDGSGTVVAFVEFKRGRVKRFESVGYFPPGKYVIVDGDRGQDCGLVVHTCIRQMDGTISRSDTLEGVSIDLNKVKPETGRVLRPAEDREIEMLHGEIATMERYALKTCRDRVAQMGLNMDVVDCEFQFDRKKVTFFFDAPEAIDFRELTKDLFKTFGARIWLENINTKVKNVVPDGALSHADKMLYAERGLRAPRR